MKIQNILLCILTLSCLYSCSDDFGKRTAPETGTPIRFSAYIATENGSRTSYGDLNSDNKWPIYWSNGDAVSIYCPEAFVEDGTSSEDVADTKTGKYTINVTSDTETTYSLSGLNSLCWGASDDHNFFTVYPSSVLYHRNADGNDDGTFVLSVPREQSATLQKEETVNGTTVWRYADMNASVMAGHKPVKKSQVDENTVIDLPFNPITTAFDIEILPPADGEYESYTITSVQIANSEEVTDGRTALAGGFKYNAKTKTYDEYSYSGEDVSALTVNVQLPTGGVTLTRGNNEKLVVTAFLLPDNLPSTLRVIVNCKKTPSEGSVLTGETGIVYKNIDLSSSSNVCGKKNTIKLGNLPNPITFSYETWMANLPDNTYVSQISMPGTHDAGAYPADEGSSITDFFTDLFAQTQNYSIEEQLNAGVRVLDFRPKYRTSSNDFNIAHGAATYNNRTFDIVMTSMIEWLAKHPTEFIVVLLKNEYGTGDWDSSSNKPVFLGWIKNINEKLRTDKYAEYTIEEFDPAMTLKNARGKMLYMSRDYYAPTDISDEHYANVEADWSTYQDYYTDWFGCKISGWPDNKKQSEAGAKSFYVKNPDSKYTPDAERNYVKASGTFYYSDYYKRTIIIDLAVTESNKNTEIQSALSNAKNNSGESYKDVWYMTWLNVYGSGESRSSGHNGTTATYITNNFSTGTSYNRTGIVMADWVDSDNGLALLKAVIDNNFKAGGPAQKTN